MEILVSIGVRLREVRENMGLSQTAFAEIAEKKGAAGATRQSQANYEKGKQAPGATYFAAIAAAGADVQYILTGIRATVALGVSEPQASYVAVTRREAALLDNYRHTADEEDKRAIEQTALMAARSATKGEAQSGMKKKRA
jgi:transcriptional regulator with XRE-family HTH domain